MSYGPKHTHTPLLGDKEPFTSLTGLPVKTWDTPTHTRSYTHTPVGAGWLTERWDTWGHYSKTEDGGHIRVCVCVPWHLLGSPGQCNLLDSHTCWARHTPCFCHMAVCTPL